ncbi:MAG TPA: helix-turn-helix domain-containing protein [Phycisphaerae bacterium]|nr:helix-turn-helix domain-containing protein [Phycisphaerae bacterium]HQE29951.1 helix-turn-helix domain-containing protein [Phycisphaerae bacterium]
MRQLLTPKDVDTILRYPSGRAARLARAGKLPHVTLPDGEIRFDQAEIEELLAESKSPANPKGVQS